MIKSTDDLDIWKIPDLDLPYSRDPNVWNHLSILPRKRTAGSCDFHPEMKQQIMFQAFVTFRFRASFRGCTFGLVLVMRVRKVATCTIHGSDRIEYAHLCSFSLGDGKNHSFFQLGTVGTQDVSLPNRFSLVFPLFKGFTVNLSLCGALENPS